MLMSPLNGVNKELTGRVSLCAARAGGVMAAVSVCNYTLSRCILAAVVGEQAAQPCTRQGGGRREGWGGGGESQHLLCFLHAPRTPHPSVRAAPERWLCWAQLGLGGGLAGAALRMGCSTSHLLLSPLKPGEEPLCAPLPPQSWGWAGCQGWGGSWTQAGGTALPEATG